MTDRIHALTVVLDQDYRDDDVQAIINAIEMIKGVIKVDSTVTTHNDFLARTKIKYEIRNKILDLLV